MKQLDAATFQAVAGGEIRSSLESPQEAVFPFHIGLRMLAFSKVPFKICRPAERTRNRVSDVLFGFYDSSSRGLNRRMNVRTLPQFRHARAIIGLGVIKLRGMFQNSPFPGEYNPK
jgi:hypothetical protein